jgi:hypothetical protein
LIAGVVAGFIAGVVAGFIAGFIAGVVAGFLAGFIATRGPPCNAMTFATSSERTPICDNCQIFYLEVIVSAAGFGCYDEAETGVVCPRVEVTLI